MRVFLLSLSVAVLLGAPAAMAQPASHLPWKIRWYDVPPLSIPATIRNNSQYRLMMSRLEYYGANDTVKGIRVDLNGDGAIDYIVRSAPSLCGNAGCDFGIFDGATRRSLGELGGGMMCFLADTVRGYPTIVARTRLGWAQAEYATYRFSGSAYVEASRRVESAPTRDSLDAALDSIPWWRSPPPR